MKTLGEMLSCYKNLLFYSSSLMEGYFLAMRIVDILYFYTLDGCWVFLNKWIHYFRNGNFLPRATGERQTQMHDFIICVPTFLFKKKKAYSKICNNYGQNTLSTPAEKRSLDMQIKHCSK